MWEIYRTPSLRRFILLGFDLGVLRIRGQVLDEDGLQRFSARFGPLEEIPTGRMSAAQKAKIKNRYVTQLSNILVDGKPIGGLGILKPVGIRI